MVFTDELNRVIDLLVCALQDAQIKPGDHILLRADIVNASDETVKGIFSEVV